MVTTTKARDTKRTRSSERRAGTTSRDPGTEGAHDDGKHRITAKNLTADDRRFLERRAARLSPSTLRAKWIHTPDEHADRPGQTLATRSPEVVKSWADERKAIPATVGRRDGDRPRTLRFDFPSNGASRRLEPVDWDAWLGTFRDRDLVFIYQERRRDGRESNFFRLDSPEREAS